MKRYLLFTGLGDELNTPLNHLAGDFDDLQKVREFLKDVTHKEWWQMLDTADGTFLDCSQGNLCLSKFKGERK